MSDSRGIVSIVTWAVLLVTHNSVQAQPPFRLETVPFTDPQRMFEQMFGEDSAEDRAALRKISISADDEADYGARILESGLVAWKKEGIEIVSKGRAVEYLQSLVETLQPHMTQSDRYPQIRVLLAKSPRVDARSCPGGTLIIFQGLLDAARNEAALVGILSHELSHLDRGHQLLPLKRIKLMERKFKNGFQPDEFFQNGPWMIKLMARPFRPEDEKDADTDGVAWAFAAGYDPREMAKLFQHLAEEQKEPKQQADLGPNFFRTHPAYRERQQLILKQVTRLRKKHPQQELFIGEENLRERQSRKQAES